MKIELIMAEFGEERKNMGGNVFDGSQRLDPTLTTFTNNMKSKHDLKLTLITDTEVSVNTPLPYRVEMIDDKEEYLVMKLIKIQDTQNNKASFNDKAKITPK